MWLWRSDCWLSKAIEIIPKFPEAYINRGVAKDQLKDYEGAIADYTKALEIYPKDSLAYANNMKIKLETNLMGYLFKIGESACDDWQKASYLGIMKHKVGKRRIGSLIWVKKKRKWWRIILKDSNRRIM